MAVFDKVKTVSSPGVTPLHTSVAKRCTVEIIEGRGAVLLSRRINGAVLDGPFAVNCIGLKLGQTIPVGVIRASLPSGGSSPST
jgi:hypothetical protein